MKYINSEQKIIIGAYLIGLKRRGVRFAIYGTGNVLFELLELCKINAVFPFMIVDHSDYGEALFAGFPFKNIADVEEGEVDEIVLATNLYQKEMLEHIRNQLGAGVHILDIAPSIFTGYHDEFFPEERLLYRDHYAVCSKIYALSEETCRYVLYGPEAFVVDVLNLLTLQKLLFPVSIILSTNPNMLESISGVQVESKAYLDSHPDELVVIASKAHATKLKADLLEQLKRFHPVLDIFTDKFLGFSCFNHAKLPFITNFHLTLGLTNHCNLACRYCPQHSPLLTKRCAEWKSESLDIEKIVNVLPQFKGRIQNVLVSYTGDPLLYPYLDELFSFINDCGFGIEVYTNGMLLDKAMSERLSSHNIGSIHVSLDGVDAAFNKKETGLDLSRVIENVSYFSRLTGVPVVLNPVVSKRNLEHISGLCELDIPTLAGVRVQPIRVFDKVGKDVLDVDLLGINDLLRLEESFGRNASEVEHFHYALSKLYPRSYGDMCVRPWTGAIDKEMVYQISPDGELSSCTVLGSIGNIFENTFVDIVNGERAQKQRIATLRNEYKEGCFYYCNYAREV